MISKSDFSKLKHGDVVLWRNKRSVIFRTVVDGPADKSWKGAAVEFAIRRRSWTGRAKTTYDWNAVKHRIKLIKRTSLIMLSEEFERLKTIGFNPRKEIIREFKEAEAAKIRMGRELCQRIVRIPA